MNARAAFATKQSQDLWPAARLFGRPFGVAKNLAIGLATHLPPVRALSQRKSRGSDNARYCYSVWLRHLAWASENRLCVRPPRSVAKLGPGDTIGVGLAALLSGAENYYGLDEVPYANVDDNLEIFDELVSLFSRQAPIPREDEFPLIKPFLDDYAFPHRIITPGHLARCLAPDRLARIRRAIAHGDEMIFYAAPWRIAGAPRRNSVEMLISQAVMQYIDDLPAVYAELAGWLTPGGFMSHQISYESHGFAHEWNGHWSYSDELWSLMKGVRAYTLSREPHSSHVAAISAAGLEIAAELKGRSENRLSKAELAPRFRGLGADDLTTSNAFIQAFKAPGYAQTRPRRSAAGAIAGRV